MHTFDFSPLFRSAVGFDRLYSMLDNANRTAQSQPSYPPYNIELLDEDSYRITMAVAGFEDGELDIQIENSVLTVSGKKAEDEKEHKFLHQGIAARNFEHRFQLADHVKVMQANLTHGLLNIDLVREIPETMKPRKIAINDVRSEAVLEQSSKKVA